MQRLLLLFVVTCLVACGGGGGGGSSSTSSLVTVRSPSVLSISAYYYTEPLVSDSHDLLIRYLQAFQLARDAGATGQFQSYRWSDLEPSLGVYDNAKLAEFISAMENAEQNALVQLVGLQIINTVTREVPAGLENTAWNDAAMMDAFEGLLDQLLRHMQGRVMYLSIGNEVDVYFENGRMAELPDYSAFFNAVQSYLNSRLPNVHVGITVTAGGFLGGNVQSWLDLTDASDILVTTYYPLQSDFSVQPSNAPAVDFPNLLALAGDKPIVFQEVGYPSSSVAGSSEAMQAEFVRQVFAVWNDNRQRIPFLNWFLLHDFSTVLVDEFVSYYGVGDPKFRAYLDSLGLRNRNNTDKQAWPVLVQEAQAFYQ